MNKRQKKKRIRLSNRKLVKEFPFLLPYNVWTGKRDPYYNYDYTWLDDMPIGWKKRFGLELCRDLKSALISSNALKDYQIIQIKEKWGQLCIYANISNDEIYQIISDYEYISEHTCANCGSLDTPMTDDGWVLPLCEKCYNHHTANGKIKCKNKGYDHTYPAYKDIICDNSSLATSYKTTKFTIEGTHTIEHNISHILERIK